MGKEVAATHFKHYDFCRFERHMRAELARLQEWLGEGRFSTRMAVGGLELEAWLIDAGGQPVPWNEQVIAAAGSDDIVTEISRFNLEFNVAPQPLADRGIEALEEELRIVWRCSDEAARPLGARVLSIGLLPTLSDQMLSLANMSPRNRYRALNEQVLRLRQGQPIRVQIDGRDALRIEHRDVMLESATTSFQLHLQVPAAAAVRYYNASLIASAASVAVAANSPLLFGRQLWEETRIPIFEQAVDTGPGSPRRVTFGHDYARDSLLGIFQDSVERFPMLLPLALDEPSERLSHLRLHNGTIWRWNRPLLGFDDDGVPHLRVEHRVMAAGPTVADMAANMAFFYGLVESLVQAATPPEQQLSFTAARANFYAAARDGLNSEVTWLDGRTGRLDQLILEELLPRADQGLRGLDLEPSLIEDRLAIIEARVRTGQTGSAWQRQYLEQHPGDFAGLTLTYAETQEAEQPVHTWSTARRVLSKRRPASQLHVIDKLPDRFLTIASHELDEILHGPTLIHLPGLRTEPLFVSILLHGNEDVGLLAIQQCLAELHDRPLPRALSLFVGNVRAARDRVRRLAEQPDYNRVWPGSNLTDTPEHAVMRHVLDEMRGRRVFASIDLHNNTGWNPHYACVSHVRWPDLQLAALFSRTAVYFRQPLGVQTRAFAELAPSVTCECGKVGDPSGVQHAAAFVNACLHLSSIPNHPLPQGDLHLFHTIATMKVPSRVAFSFDDAHASDSAFQHDLLLRGDLERLNFQELAAGCELGWASNASAMPVQVSDESGRDVTGEFLEFHEGAVRLRRPVIPAMLTCNAAVIQQDCLGYLMERYPLQLSEPGDEGPPIIRP